ncbi:MAG: HTTM domain-containing protein, partial [Bacteroidetes bacterium]|nr:HTTM domain-containing protein [Bacteroidota bacterium]
MTEIKSKVFSYFEKQVSIAPLIVFRIIFGALLLFGTLRFLINGWVETLYIEPRFHFGYLAFEWIEKLPGNWMYLPFVLCIIGSIGIIFGYFYR